MLKTISIAARHRAGLVVLMLALSQVAGVAESIDADFTNRLADESSPYLRLHAHNPVDWYPWGDEALGRARRENKPIFLSVGYSTCYWCHVMEREVFSNPEIAGQMNDWFVNIKVDREEHPELDEIYMIATQLLTGHGGWPNSVFLTPDLQPFFAGSYFPPEPRHGRPGFPDVLRSMHEAWINRRPDVLQAAEKLTAAIGRVMVPGATPVAEVPDASAAGKAVQELKGRFDSKNGGFGPAPKFPSPPVLFLLWESGDDEARSMVAETLRAMGRGAIFDQLAGGFHRYTLDAAWRIPHFEKMLYDNALLVDLLATVSAATGDDELEWLARRTCDFVLGHLRHENGAFLSAIDAETDGVEGAYYIWTREEVERALNQKETALLLPILGLDGLPNVEGGKHTLFLSEPLNDIAARAGLGVGELRDRMQPALDKLEAVRSRRPYPLIDDKILTDWNGMMVAALARTGMLLDEPGYVAAARNATGFLLNLRGADGVLLHAWRDGSGVVRAFLDDYAYLIRALLVLHEATAEDEWLSAAEGLADEMERRLRDPLGGYFTAEASSDLLVRARSAIDGAIPSGNGIAANALQELAERTENPVYRERSEASLRAFNRELTEAPESVPSLARAALRYSRSQSEAGPAEPRESVQSLATLARSVVTAEARRTDPGNSTDWERFDLEAKILDGWHLTANPAGSEFLVPTEVTGDVRGLAYPPGTPFQADFASGEILIYSTKATIRGEISGEAEWVRLTYQACDDRRCLPPMTTTIPVR